MNRLLNTVMMVAFAACGGDPAERVDGRTDGPDSARVLTADHTVDELLADDHPTAAGTLFCADGADWTVYGWRVPMNNRRDGRGLPAGAPEVSAPVAEDGTFLLAMPSGPRRFIAAVQGSTRRIAWSDPHARTFPLRQPLVGLDLDCDLVPTPASDGSTVVSQGEVDGADRSDRVYANNEKPLDQTALGSTPARAALRVADKVAVGSRAHEDLLRRRYEADLSEDEMKVLLPLLMQLSDDPDAADRLVGRSKRVKHFREHPEELPASTGPVGLIEMTHSHGGGR